MTKEIKKSLAVLLAVASLCACGPAGDKAQPQGDKAAAEAAAPLANRQPAVAEAPLAAWHGAAIDTLPTAAMQMRNPSLFADQQSRTYYLAGEGGAVWRSRNLLQWEGPYDLLQFGSDDWFGSNFSIDAMSLLRYDGNYYCYVTLTLPDSTVLAADGKPMPCRTSLVMGSQGGATGPYRVVAERPLLPLGECSIDPHFCSDDFNAPYMVYSCDARQTGDGTVQIIRLTDDLKKKMGDPYIMFTASQAPWAHGKGGVCEAPSLFLTEEEDDGPDSEPMLGMLWNTRIGGQGAVGVLCSETGTLNGPWIPQPAPLLSGGYGGARLFTSFEGRSYIVCHRKAGNRYTLQLIPVDIRDRAIKLMQEKL